MSELPRELYSEIFSYLEQRHLRSVAQTCRDFAALTKPMRFSQLHFHGDAQEDRYYVENDQHVSYPGRKQVVEIATIEAAVEDVLSLGIGPYVKQFVFAPKHYVEDFWLEYRQWVENEVEPDDAEDFHRMGDPSDYESDEEYMYVGMRRIAEERGARPAKERELVEAAETIWATKVEEQLSKAQANHDALVRMFESMTALRGIEVVHWCCSLEEYGIEDRCDQEVLEQFASCKTVWTQLNMLSSAIGDSGRRIAQLTLPGFDPLSITINPSLERLFGSLTMLSFNIDDLDFMSPSSSHNVANVIKLLSCATQTLQDLEFRNHSVPYPQLPPASEKDLNKLLVNTFQDLAEKKIAVFTNLKAFKLRSIILETTSFLAFLSSQPALQYASFEHVYLATTGYTWADVAQAMPLSCSKFYVSQCGHEIYSPQSPVAVNHIKPYHPFKEQFSPEKGWQANEAIFDREMKQQWERGVDRWGHKLHLRPMSTAEHEEWMQGIKMATRHAMIERL
ncbi:unnamed protein product [Periconia digitata]|uniref:F-box domain-containing protein n=1 Tax=Periconia digitata TaxID=1303443 RepID=A0A9W4XNZ9_9PLEO|nr:unnamed protein product [Periconia digitata]